MSEQNEPTMEEILASIRRIISEEGEDKADDTAAAAPRPPAPKAAAPQPVAAAPEPVTPMDQTAIDDVFELTEVVEDTPDSDAETAPEPEADPWESTGDEDAPAEDEGLVSPAAAALTASQFSVLSNLLTSGYPGEGRTLEQLVELMLRPMLKAWLDEHLPNLVERLVAQEIERLSRKRP